MENNSQEQLNNLFNPQVEEIKNTPTYTDYRPSAAKGKNGTYQAIIRFVPWWGDPKHGSIREKWSCFLVDPLTEKGRGVDCPSSIGQPSILQDMYFKCKNSDNALLNSKKDIFSRRHVFAALIQVIKDEQNPDLEGKIIPWKFGVKIYDKLQAELKPMIGEKHDPFDILTGKAFALIITKVSGFNNYDNSKFLDKQIPLLMPNESGQLAPISTTTDKQSVFDFVKSDSPDLPEFHDFKPWDQTIHDYVNQVITQVTGVATTPSNYAAASNANTADKAGTVVESGITSSNLNLDDLTTPEVANDPLAGLDLPDLSAPSTDGGITGDLDDVLKNL